MHPIFTITVDDIRRLTDEQSRELVARLCRAELRKRGISESSVKWGGDQRAKDGGVDVRVDIEPVRGITGYIKKDRSAFQVKAENFSKGKIPDEMAPKGMLRPAIVELSENDGAYIIVSTRDTLSDSSLSERISAMGTCLAVHGLEGKVALDFYDCRKIADWVEQHPDIVVWIRQVLGKPINGWRPYSPWAYKETELDSEYLIDDRVKVFVPNADEGIDVLNALNRLRGDLAKSVSVRIVGLSGVGKTRLVQALFDKRVVTALSALDPENVLYTDLADNPTPQPSVMMEALISSDADCVVVVDNCGPDIHQRLTEIAKSTGSKLRLVTIEYDIRDDLPEETLCYRLEGSSDDIVKKLLKRRFKILSENDVEIIAEFSDGNARVAFALASTSETAGELARLRDSELFKRLFIQKNTDSEELQRCAEVASLLYSFDVEDTSSSSELATLASLSEVSINSFSRHIVELQRRGLVQARGKWRAVLPHAIANRLAANALDSFPRGVLIEVLVEKATDRVARSFSRRLGYLHELKSVREIVRDWLSPGGRYADLAALNEMERQIFENIAPVQQDATLEALDRATANPDFVSIENRERGRFARIVRSLAYEPELFEKAVNILARFALAEPEEHKHDSTRDMLKSLFYSHLSGTEARVDQRSKFVRDLLLSKEEVRQKLGISLLEAALEAVHFSSHYGFDFGARKRGYGWWPRNFDDVRSWYTPFIEVAVEVGKGDAAHSRKARTILADAVRGLWVFAGLRKEITDAANDLMVIDGWPEGWLGLRRILQWDKDEINQESRQEVIKLERKLAPRGLREQIVAKVLARGALEYDFDEAGDDADSAVNKYYKAEQEAENLGRAAARENGLLIELLPDLLRNNTNGKVVNFGIGAGQEGNDAFKLMDAARGLVMDAAPGSVSLLFLRGFISGWMKSKPNEVSAFLDKALLDDVWGKWFPELQLMPVGLDHLGYERLLKSLELGTAPVWQYRYLAFGRVTDSLTVNQIFTLVDAIVQKPDEGMFVIADLLSMVIHCASEKDANYRQELGAACIQFLKRLDWAKTQGNNDHFDHDIGEILDFALGTAGSGDELSRILEGLLTYLRTDIGKYSRSGGEYLKAFFKHHPKQTLDAVYVVDDDGSYSTAFRIVSRFSGGRRETAIEAVPADTLIAWCEISPEDRYIFVAETCLLFEKEPSEQFDASNCVALSEIAKQVLSQARDKKAVLRIFIDRFYPTSWSGNLSTILKERLPLLETLNPTNDEDLRNEIAQAVENLKKRIAREEEREDEWERGRTGSFE